MGRASAGRKGREPSAAVVPNNNKVPNNKVPVPLLDPKAASNRGRGPTALATQTPGRLAATAWGRAPKPAPAVG